LTPRHREPLNLRRRLLVEIQEEGEAAVGDGGAQARQRIVERVCAGQRDDARA
jgi:hypothetical protein